MGGRTLAGVVDDLSRRGFTEHFAGVRGGLRALGSGKTFPADQIAVLERYRFEGASDPDDMAIVYALETRSGIRGTLADAFGVYADPAVGVVMRDVPFRPVGRGNREAPHP
jgi:hypothetical protein